MDVPHQYKILPNADIKYPLLSMYSSLRTSVFCYSLPSVSNFLARKTSRWLRNAMCATCPTRASLWWSKTILIGHI